MANRPHKRRVPPQAARPSPPVFSFKVTQSNVEESFRMLVPIYLELADGHTVSLGYHETLDVHAAIAYLRTERPEQAREIMGLGVSMGAAPLVRAAQTGRRLFRRSNRSHPGQNIHRPQLAHRLRHRCQ